MNKYFKLDDDEEVFITSDNFSEEAIVYMDKVGLGNCDEFLNEFENLVVGENVFNPVVEECFNIIRNFMEIGNYLAEAMYEDPAPYFETAMGVMRQELQIAMDYNERQYNVGYSICDNPSDKNYAYAKQIIYDILIKTVFIGKNSSKNVLDIYKEVAEPNYVKIQSITIDEVEFKNIKDAQAYINTQIFLEVESVYDDEGIFSPIHMVVSDELEVFEITLDMTDAFDVVGCLETTLFDGITSVVDELLQGNESDYIIKGEVPQAGEYEFDLHHYKDEAITIADLSFLYQDIYYDVTKHLKRHNVYFEDEQVIAFAFSTLKDAYAYQIKNDGSIEDKYLMLKFLALDNFSYKLKEDYRFDANYRDCSLGGLDELENLLNKKLLF